MGSKILYQPNKHFHFVCYEQAYKKNYSHRQPSWLCQKTTRDKFAVIRYPPPKTVTRERNVCFCLRVTGNVSVNRTQPWIFAFCISSRDIGSYGVSSISTYRNIVLVSSRLVWYEALVMVTLYGMLQAPVQALVRPSMWLPCFRKLHSCKQM